MLGKKGQSALEYLMTYGWAILIIIIVGGVLYYYGVFSPGKLVGESKVGFSRVQVDNWGVSGGDLNMKFENRAGKDINVTTIYVTYGGTTYTDNPNSVLTAGAKSSAWETVTLTSPPEAGEAYQMEVSIQYFYTDDTGTPPTEFNSSGSLSGTA